MAVAARSAPPVRDRSIDVLKTIAIFGVLTIHAAAPGTTQYPLGSAGWVASVLWGSVIRFAVPVFFLCSGALLLRPEKEITLRALYGKYLLRIVLALFFWAAAYEAFDLVIAALRGAFTPALIVPAVKRLILFDHHFHLYFLHIMLLVYALLPLTRLLARHMDKTTYRYALALFLLLAVVYPFLLPHWPFALLQGIPRQYAVNLTFGAVGYTLMGDYLQRHATRRRAPYAVLFLAGLGLTIFLTIALSLRHGAFYAGAWEGMSPGVAMMACGLFGLVRACPGLTRRLGFATAIAKASFCIYLVHDFFNILFRAAGWTLGALPGLAIPAQVLCNLGLSFLVYLVLRRIPFVRTYLL